QETPQKSDGVTSKQEMGFGRVVQPCELVVNWRDAGDGSSSSRSGKSRQKKHDQPALLRLDESEQRARGSVARREDAASQAPGTCVCDAPPCPIRRVWLVLHNASKQCNPAAPRSFSRRPRSGRRQRDTTRLRNGPSNDQDGQKIRCVCA